jgi:hypothetical protein
MRWYHPVTICFPRLMLIPLYVIESFYYTFATDLIIFTIFYREKTLILSLLTSSFSLI